MAAPVVSITVVAYNSDATLPACLRSVRDLVASIRSWITDWNDNPKPFVWHKTADQILDSLKKYLTNL